MLNLEKESANNMFVFIDCMNGAEYMLLYDSFTI